MNDNELKALLNKMTLEEKIGELVCIGGHFFQSYDAIKTGPTVNLGIDDWIIPYAGIGSNMPLDVFEKVQKDRISRGLTPLMNCSDIIHGYKTIFPIPLALSSSFDMKLIEKCAHIWGKEAGYNGVQISYSPMLDLVRDPRWGRVMESFGEDPYLGKCYAKAYIKGMQGTLKDNSYIGATVKHFAGYSLPRGGREYEMSTISDRMFNDYYLPPYTEGLKNSLMVMSGFNCLDYVPISMNKSLLTGLLRNKIGFKGPIISDYNAINELVNHKVAKNDKEAALLAFKAGIDIDLMSACYPNYLKELYQDGLITIDEINEKVLRVLRAKNKLNLFENPFRFNRKLANIVDKNALSLAKKAASSSMVLLKNEDDILPLQEENKIVFVGPFIDDNNLYSSWALFNDKRRISLKNAFKARKNVHFVSTNYIFNEPLKKNDFLRLKSLIDDNTTVIVLVGEKQSDSGEAASKVDINLNLNHIDLIKKIHTLTKNIVSVIYGGRPLILTEINDLTKAMLFAFLPGTMGSEALFDIIFGKTNPSAKLPISFPRSIGQIPIYYQSLNTGRPLNKRIEINKYYSSYIDSPNEPLYSFGYGLSYSKFIYSSLKINKKKFDIKDKIEISVDVFNESKRDGYETVLLYIEDMIGSVSRPIKELKAFKRIKLKSNEKKTVNFIITEKDLRFTSLYMKKRCEKGTFRVEIASLENYFEII